MAEFDAQRIVIAGGSGFIGLSLASYLAERGAEVTILSRRPPRISVRFATGTSGVQKFQYAAWDGRTMGDWWQSIDHVDAIVNLCGRSVDCIKTPDHCDEIIRSRVESTNVLGDAMRQCDSPPPVWVQMSTAHLYGDPPRHMCDETSAYGLGLAPTVARAWEGAFDASRLPNQRGVILRTSFVVGIDRGAGGGAMSTLGRLAKFGLGGRVGSGRQGFSWIDEVDLNRIFAQSISDQTMSGAYIASSPNPVSQADFMKALRKAIGMPIGLPSFSWMVKIGAPLLMRTDPDLALYGRYVFSKRLAEHGFEFTHPHLESSLEKWRDQRRVVR